jgi:hypothetical protein
MDNKITGAIIKVGEIQKGVSKAGNNWVKQEYVLQTMGEHPKTIAFNLMGKRVAEYPMQLGEVVTISFDINSREYNGRWHTDITAWAVSKEEPQAEHITNQPNNTMDQYQQLNKELRSVITPQGGAQSNAPFPETDGCLPF